MQVADAETAAAHATWMREAHRQALLALKTGEVPVGAVVVVEDEIVGTGFNQSVGTGDPTAHAEILALQQAARTVRNYRLTAATLYVTIEPCLMCAGALVHARISTLVFGAPEPRAGAVQSVMRALDHPSLNHRVEVVAGVQESECRELMQAFFRARREPLRSRA